MNAPQESQQPILSCSNKAAEAMQAVRNHLSWTIATRAHEIAVRANNEHIRTQDILDACAQLLPPDVFEEVYDQLGPLSVTELMKERLQKAAQSPEGN